MVDLPTMGMSSASSHLTLPWWQGSHCGLERNIIMKQVFEVQVMSCGHCVKAVTQAVQAVDPHAQVAVDLPAGRVEVESAEERDALAHAIEEEGYKVAG